LNLWIKDEREGYFAAGCDRDEFGRIRAMKIRKAIPFFLLNSELFSQKNDRMKKIIEQCAQAIFSPDFLALGGVRSLAASEPRFMPGAYHNGNSWPMQTFQISKGLRKQGFEDLAQDLENRIVKAVEYLKIYPEFVNGGFDSEIKISNRMVDTYDPNDKRKNRREQPPQQIQLWTLSAYGAIKYQRSKL
jgi:glycogen debranching enzyme